MTEFFGSKTFITVAIITFCCLLLWSGGSVIAAFFVALIVVFYIAFPGIYICTLCGIKDHLLATGIAIGFALFVSIYSIYLASGLYAMFFALPLLLGGVGLFTSMGQGYNFNISVLRFTALPIFIFSIAILPTVAVAIFNPLPLCDISVYQAANLMTSPPQSQDIYTLIAAAIAEISGQPGYNVIAFYLPIISLILLCITIYELADRLLKNSKRALLATLIFLIASPFTFPGLDGGVFVGKEILFDAQLSLSLAITASVLLCAERAISSKNILSVIPAVAGFAITCFFEPQYAAILLLAIFLIFVIYLVTGRINLNLFLIFAIFAILFATFCHDFYLNISVAPGLPQGLQIDSLLRNSFIVSPVLYYILLPIGFVVAILAALLPIFPALTKSFLLIIKRLKSTGFGTMSLVITAVLSAVLAFLLKDAYEPLSSLALLLGSICAAKMFAYKAPIVKTAIVTSIAIGTFNIALLLMGGISAQLQSFGYFTYDVEQQLLEPKLYSALSYIRDNTADDAVIATNHPIDTTVIGALSDRECKVSDISEVGSFLFESTMKSEGIDYLLLYNYNGEDLSQLTTLYSDSSYTVVGL